MASFHDVLSALFSTRHEKDVPQDMPQQNKLSLESLLFGWPFRSVTTRFKGQGMRVDGCVSGFDPVLV